MAHHLHEGRLAGADQGVRWNIRVRRFVKSYLTWLRPIERYYFLQGPGLLRVRLVDAGRCHRDVRFHDTRASHARGARDTA